MNVLIADDDRLHVQLISSRLRKLGFNVLVVFDALQAWMTAVRNHPDAVILDIGMPAGSGLEVLRKLKTSVKTNQIPVIVVSGSIDPKDAHTALESGADEFIPKPVDLEKLSSALCRLLGQPQEPSPEGRS